MNYKLREFINKMTYYVSQVNEFFEDSPDKKDIESMLNFNHRIDSVFEDFITHYKCNDKVHGLCLGMEFMEIEEIIREYSQFPEYHIPDAVNINSFVKGKIKEDYFNPNWLPFAHDLGGNFIGFDFSSGCNGKMGQIINFGRDEEDLYVIADDFDEFLKLVLRLYKSGNCRVEEDDRGTKVIVWNNGGHILDDLLGYIYHGEHDSTNDIRTILENLSDEWKKVISEHCKNEITLQQLEGY